MQARHLKSLGLLLLALIGAMAINASAASAKWLLLANEKSISKFITPIAMPETELGFSGPSFVVNCASGKGAVGLETIEAASALKVGAELKYTGCVLSGLEEVCEAHGLGQPKGTIVVTGWGTASMGFESVESELTPEGFTKAELDGNECPLWKLTWEFEGNIFLTVLEALKDLASHTVEINISGPGVGSSLEEGTSSGAEPFAIHLVELE